MALDRDAELPGAQLIASHHVARGRNQAAGPWIRRAAALEEVHRAAQAERSRMAASDPVEPHRLSPVQARALVKPFQGHPRVKRLYLVRKRLRHRADRDPAFAVAIVPRRPWWKPWDDARARSLAAELASRLPAGPSLFLFVESRASRVLFRRARKIGADLLA